MDSHFAADAISVSVPSTVTVLVWFVSTEPTIRILSVVPVISALLQLYRKPRAKLEVTSLEEIKVDKDGNQGFRFKGSARSKGRPIVSNVETKLQFDPPMKEYYVHVSEVEGQRTMDERKTWGSTKESGTFGQAGKLRQGDGFQFEHHYDEASEGGSVNAQGKTVMKSYYRFFAYSGKTPCRVRALVQGDDPDGNTVSAKKDIHVMGVPNPE
jgi:hypothetical protein